MLTMEEAMDQAIVKAKSFCNKYGEAPFGNTFTEFRTITTQKFFDSLYNNSLILQIKDLESRLEGNSKLKD